MLLSLLILSVNVGVGIPGWWLWTHGDIALVQRPFPAAILDGAMMFVYFDLCMYSLHRFMHVSWLYRVIHRRHHDHTNVSGISLYVMNPVEAAGFGILLILFLLARACDINALLAFLLARSATQRFQSPADCCPGSSAMPRFITCITPNSGATTVSLPACGIVYGEHLSKDPAAPWTLSVNMQIIAADAFETQVIKDYMGGYGDLSRAAAHVVARLPA